MNTRKLRSTLIGSVGMALAFMSGSALAISFQITDLGTLGGTFSHGHSIRHRFVAVMLDELPALELDTAPCYFSFRVARSNRRDFYC
jgi:hypothetical protein